MARPLRYGPAYSGTVADARYSYDPTLDETTWKGAPFGPPKAGSLKAVLRAGNAHGATSQSKARVGMPRFSFDKDPEKSKREMREETERRMEERLQQIIKALEFGMTELNEVQAPHSYDRRVNQFQIANVLLDLKNKCLVNRASS